jgi:phosphatidylinositol-3-phosphatase
MPKLLHSCVVALLGCSPAFTAAAADVPPWPPSLPRYDHIVIVVEENKDYDQIIGNRAAPYLNKLAVEGVEGANFTRMFAEEHNSEGNYFWLFSGSNQNVGFRNRITPSKFKTSNLGRQLIIKGLL